MDIKKLRVWGLFVLSSTLHTTPLALRVLSIWLLCFSSPDGSTKLNYFFPGDQRSGVGRFIELVIYKYFSTAFSLTIKLRTKTASSPFRVVCLFNYKGTPRHASASLLGDTLARLVSHLTRGHPCTPCEPTFVFSWEWAKVFQTGRGRRPNRDGVNSWHAS